MDVTIIEEYKAGRLTRKALDQLVIQQEFEAERQATIDRVRALRLRAITWEWIRDNQFCLGYRETFTDGGGI